MAACQTLSRICNGLDDKANRTGKYGWLSYRGDLKLHHRKNKEYFSAKQLFASTITSEVDAGSNIITVAARILDPKSDQIIEENVDLYKNQYADSVDADGYVYIMRSYDEGKQKSILIKKSVWLEFKESFVRTPEQQEADIKELRKYLTGE